ncbi:hypothetical protein [Stigmatella erecta]|uniref:Uncharacterized protein n=1 Tax=Stigmatella erecta TaxID=83460 RepID=A0A1I0H087_9BACT|nr:hypothetical protein [Stigmatella erecta]SET76935.1 hypothetical protein SAMN05443639_104250 [Stigmatella erecta]
MDPKEWMNRNVGIPVDPAKQKDPDEDGDRVPAEGRKEHLNDITEQHGGQRTEVGPPYDGSGDRQTGQWDKYSDRDDLEEHK